MYVIIYAHSSSPWWSVGCQDGWVGFLQGYLAPQIHKLDLYRKMIIYQSLYLSYLIFSFYFLQILSNQYLSLQL